MPDVIEVERKDRDESGRFAKGNKVPAPRRGRPARGDITSVLIAVAQNAYSPEQITDMLRETYDMSKKQDDWKGMFQVIQFVVNYAVGKPVQRSVTASVDPEYIKTLLSGRIVENEERDAGSEISLCEDDEYDEYGGGSPDAGDA